MRCPNCNYDNKDNSSFCIMCGTKLQKPILNKGSTNSDKNERKLAYVVSDEEEIDESLLASTVESPIGELVYYTCSNVMDKKCFKYNVNDLITLQEYSSKVLSKEEFLTVLLNLLNAVSGLGNRGIGLNNLFLKRSQIFINPKNLMVKMICIPVLDRKLDISLGLLVKEIILNTEYDYNENCKYIKDLLRVFDENKNFDVNLFVNLIEKFLEESEEEMNNVSMNNMYMNNAQVNNVQATSMQVNNKSFEEEYDANATSLLEPEYDLEGTTILSQEPEYPYLIRLNNKEKIIINKSIFRIGKDRYNTDYTVIDNSAVSRQHADIITKNGEYFIMDLGSTNHTYINGRIIYDKVEIKIENENVIKLGNEEFQFYIY